MYQRRNREVNTAVRHSSATTNAYTTNNLNQYTRVGAATYAYGKNGNLTSDGTRSYRWDAENRLVGVTVPGATEGATATTVAYAYDDQHRRVKKTVGTATTYFLWSGDDLLAEYAGNGTLKRRYLHGVAGYTPLQVHDVSGATTTAYDVHTDHLDTPRLITNSTGAAVWRSRHRAFGQAHIEADPDGDGTSLAFPFRFPGQYEDAETRLHYNRHRYYSPELGRYLSADWVGQADDLNLYQYAMARPLNASDPLGLYSWTEFMVDASNASAGFGDTLSFGGTGWIRDKIAESLFGNSQGLINTCSGAHSLGEWGAIGMGTFLGGAAGLAKTGAKAAGKEFSHFIPKRTLDKVHKTLKDRAPRLGKFIRDTFGRSRANGNYVTPLRHSRHDYRRRLKGQNARRDTWPLWKGIPDRVPGTYYGPAAAGAAGGSAAAQGEDCPCPR